LPEKRSGTAPDLLLGRRVETYYDRNRGDAQPPLITAGTTGLQSQKPECNIDLRKSEKRESLVMGHGNLEHTCCRRLEYDDG